MFGSLSPARNHIFSFPYTRNPIGLYIADEQKWFVGKRVCEGEKNFDAFVWRAANACDVLRNTRDWAMVWHRPEGSSETLRVYAKRKFRIQHARLEIIFSRKAILQVLGIHQQNIGSIQSIFDRLARRILPRDAHTPTAFFVQRRLTIFVTLKVRDGGDIET